MAKVEFEVFCKNRFSIVCVIQFDIKRTVFFLYSLLSTQFYFCYFSDCREACVVCVVTRLRRRLVTEIVSTCIEKNNGRKF